MLGVVERIAFAPFTGRGRAGRRYVTCLLTDLAWSWPLTSVVIHVIDPIGNVTHAILTAVSTEIRDRPDIAPRGQLLGDRLSDILP